MSSSDDVRAQAIAPEHPLGVMVRPSLRPLDPVAWCERNREMLDFWLYRHGAVLLRDFASVDAARFEDTASAAFGELFGDYGDLPRSAAGARIYQSTPYPPSLMILWHNESSHLGRWPMRIAFHCAEPARRGGCTPLVDTRALMCALDPEIVASFRRKGLTYVRNFVAGVEPSWERFFGSADRTSVESACRDDGSELAWRADGGLRVRRHAQGTAWHPDTGAEVFFNQVQLHHVACLDAETRDDLRALVDDERDLPRTVCYGDGSPIPDDAVRHIVATCEATCLRFTWQPGDVLLLDNMLTAHARDPYDGARRILVAMGRLTSAALLQ